MLSGADLSAGRVAAEVDELLSRLDGDLGDAEHEVVFEMRYAGQAFELEVPGTTRPDPADLIARFEQAHERRYGHRDPEGEVVLVDIRLAAVVPGPRPQPTAAQMGRLEENAREVRFQGEWIETPVLRGEPPSGLDVGGPAIFELPEATFVLPPGWHAEVDDTGTIRAEVGK
jgi:N-methylhydantoinase A